jgi:DNA-binding MarR family transcriptional regulator
MATTSSVPADVAHASVAGQLHLAIARTSRRLRQQAGQELTPSRAAVLTRIALSGPTTPSELAEAEQISRPTITRLVARLSEQGLLERVPDPADGRSYRITVSEKGATLLEHRRTRKDAYLTRLLGDVDAAELALLAGASELLLRLLEKQP